jgi:hypothetical protein
MAIKSITRDLKHEKIDYAVIGGLGVYVHGYRRTIAQVERYGL